jgi:hypothetical protein
MRCWAKRGPRGEIDGKGLLVGMNLDSRDRLVEEVDCRQGEGVEVHLDGSGYMPGGGGPVKAVVADDRKRGGNVDSQAVAGRQHVIGKTVVPAEEGGRWLRTRHQLSQGILRLI